MRITDVLQQALASTSSPHLLNDINCYLIDEYIITIDDLSLALQKDTLKKLPFAVKSELKRILQQSDTAPSSSTRQASCTTRSSPTTSDLNSVYITPQIRDIPVQKYRAIRSPPAHRARGASLPVNLHLPKRTHTNKDKDTPLAPPTTPKNRSHNIDQVHRHPQPTSALSGTGISLTLNRLSARHRTPHITTLPPATSTINRSSVPYVPSLRPTSKPQQHTPHTLHTHHKMSPVQAPSEDLIAIAHDLEHRTQEALAAIHQFQDKITTLNHHRSSQYNEEHVVPPVITLEELSLLSPREHEDEPARSNVLSSNDNSHAKQAHEIIDSPRSQSTNHDASSISSPDSTVEAEEEQSDRDEDLGEEEEEVKDEEEQVDRRELQEPDPWEETGGWMEYTTEEGDIYYYNHYTDESTWDLPAELSERHTMQAAVAHAVNICSVYHPIVVDSEPVHEVRLSNSSNGYRGEQRVYVSLPSYALNSVDVMDLPEEEQCNGFEMSTQEADDDNSSQSSSHDISVDFAAIDEPSVIPDAVRDSIRRRIAESISESANNLSMSHINISDRENGDGAPYPGEQNETQYPENESPPAYDSLAFDEVLEADEERSIVSDDSVEQLSSNQMHPSTSDTSLRDSIRRRVAQSLATSANRTYTSHIDSPIIEETHSDLSIRDTSSSPAVCVGNEQEAKEMQQEDFDSRIMYEASDVTKEEDASEILSVNLRVLDTGDDESPLPSLPVLIASTQPNESDADDVSISTYEGTVATDGRRRSGSFSDMSATPEHKKMKLSMRLKNLFMPKSDSSQNDSSF